MKENKNIDRLFQEKFRNLDVTPKEEVWENIELRLRGKKDRKVIPFWWKLSGIAAAFIISLGIYNLAFNDKVQNDIVIENDVNIDKNGNTNSLDINKIDANEVVSKENNGNENDAVDSSEKNTNEITSDENKSLKNNSSINNSIKNSDAVANKSNENKSSKSNSDLNNSIKNNDAVAKKSNENRSSKSNSDLNNSIKNNDAVANKSNENRSSKSNSDLNNSIKNNDAVANKPIENKSEIEKLNKNIDLNKSINNSQTIAENKNSDLKNDIIKKIDSASIASVEPNAMEELLNEKEKKTIKEPKLNRWQLSPNVAPIYFSSTSNGSPLDSELKNNSKQYNTNFSIGLGVNYAVNKKIKLRTGVNALAIDYNTNDVVFFQNTNARSLQHVKTNAMGDVIQIESKSVAAENLELSTNGVVVNKFSSAVNQKIGYIEIPFEMSYKVLDKRFGVDVIGGVSTLFLNQNEVSVISSGTQIMIGEANNLNDVHFSTNVGLGFKYGFFKRFEARIEPVFKYQINTFTDAGDFKPYFFGVYSGISYTF